MAAEEKVEELLDNGSEVFVASITYYEVSRELLRARKMSSVARLNAFVNANPRRYVPLTDPALRLAAELWAMKRQAGEPTADPKNIDADIILAAQALTFGVAAKELVVATTNPRHFTRLVDAKDLASLL